MAEVQKHEACRQFEQAGSRGIVPVTAREKGLPEAMIEKAFWVCWTLDYLFRDSPWKEHLTFKGGTSLYKCFDLIHRYSEDINLILDWRLLGCEKEEPWAERSRNQQDKYNKAVNARTETFLAEDIVPNLEAIFRNLLTDDFQITIDTACSFTFPRFYVRPEPQSHNYTYYRVQRSYFYWKRALFPQKEKRWLHI